MIKDILLVVLVGCGFAFIFERIQLILKWFIVKYCKPDEYCKPNEVIPIHLRRVNK